MSTAPSVAKLEQQAARVVLSLNDFEEALSYLYAKPDANAVVIRRALLTAAIIAYARPFTKNEGNPSSQATAMVALRLKRLLSKEQLALHHFLLDKRNRALAHSVSEIRPVIQKVVRPSGAVFGHLVFDVMTQAIDRPLFASLCEALHKACQESLAGLYHRMREMKDAT